MLPGVCDCIAVYMILEIEQVGTLHTRLGAPRWKGHADSSENNVAICLSCRIPSKGCSEKHSVLTYPDQSKKSKEKGEKVLNCLFFCIQERTQRNNWKSKTVLSTDYVYE